VDKATSSEVLLLFTRVPIKESMSLLSRHFEEDILRFFRHVLTAACFSISGQLYGKIYGVAMASPLSPVKANFFMEDLEEMALGQAAHKPLCWFHYVDDTFVIRPHGPYRLTSLTT
jgi:hypothetical protein